MAIRVFWGVTRILALDVGIPFSFHIQTHFCVVVVIHQGFFPGSDKK